MRCIWGYPVIRHYSIYIDGILLHTFAIPTEIYSKGAKSLERHRICGVILVLRAKDILNIEVPTLVSIR